MEHELASCLKAQQEKLGISISEIARWSKISRATVSRILSDEIGTCNFSSIIAVCRVLGVDFGNFKQTSRIDRLNEVALEKAQKLARLAKGNCSLENQSISEGSYTETVELLKAKLLSGSPRRLWARP